MTPKQPAVLPLCVSTAETDGISVFKTGYRFSRKCAKTTWFLECSLGQTLQLLKRKVFLNGVQKLDAVPFKRRRQVEQAIFQPYLHLPNTEVAYY